MMSRTWPVHQSSGVDARSKKTAHLEVESKLWHTVRRRKPMIDPLQCVASKGLRQLDRLCQSQASVNERAAHTLVSAAISPVTDRGCPPS
jgi:hypothetical protein